RLRQPALGEQRLGAVGDVLLVAQVLVEHGFHVELDLFGRGGLDVSVPYDGGDDLVGELRNLGAVEAHGSFSTPFCPLGAMPPRGSAAENADEYPPAAARSFFRRVARGPGSE